MKGHQQVGKFIRAFIALSLTPFAFPASLDAAAPSGPRPRETVYQITTFANLNRGGYEGFYPLAEMFQHGDFGIGTFHDIDGEMLVLDGVCYQEKSNGEIVARRSRDAGSALIPYAVVTFFDTDIGESLSGIETYPALQATILKRFPTTNQIVAVRIDGTFSFIKTRSVPPQKKPYPPLPDVVRQQSIFERENVQGSLGGFWFPPDFAGVNVPGFHLHFVSKDRKLGGHALELRLEKGTLRLDPTPEFHLRLQK